MPGKVNPTQCEALAMVAVQVFGNDVTVAFAGSQGNFQFNVYKPVMIHNVLESIQLRAYTCRAFHDHCAVGILPNLPVVARHLSESLMTVTALNAYIGYDKAAAIAQEAHREGTTLREAAVTSGYVTGEQFDLWVCPEKKVGP